MLYAFILGIGLMVALAFLIPWLTQVEPGKILAALKWLLFGVLAAAFLGLLLTGRLGWALAAFGAMLPWLFRLVRLFILGRVLHPRGMGGGAGGGGAAAGNGGASEVTSRFLRLRLDLGSGVMEGEVTDGRFAGRDLSTLTLREALDLRVEVATDPDSLRLLDAWLDRAHPGWGDDWGGDAGEAEPSRPGHMDRAEALRVLGLEEGADEAAIKEAYRRLMAQAHPDRGGSAWVAAKINEARDVLLR